MTEFGKTLREAREAKGLTTSQIAEQTHLLQQIVEDLEYEDFHRISAPIYGRGFVKLYCEAVGLDPKPLVDEFMAILNGERTPAIRLKDVELPPEDPIPVEPPKPAFVQPELVPSAAPPIPAVKADPLPESENHQFHPDYSSSPSAYGPSLNLGRLTIVAGGVILLLTVLILGGKALYRATMTGPGEETAAAPVETAEKPVAATSSPTSGKIEPKAKRTPKTVKPLYID